VEPSAIANLHICVLKENISAQNKRIGNGLCGFRPWLYFCTGHNSG